MLRVVRDLQDHSVSQHPWLLQKWLEYLHVICLEQFDANSRLELSLAALRQDGNITFYYKGIKRMFLEEGVVTPPYIVTGNKMRFSTDDGQERKSFEWLNEFLYLFLAIFADPKIGALLFKEPPSTLFNLVYQAHRRSTLIKAFRKQGLLMLGRDKTKEHWIAGQKSAGTKRTRGMSLDELDRLIVTFTQEQGATTKGGGIRAEAVLVASATPSRRP
ncbi:hypothetical protein BU23DRAFT_585749 [Bimuria novae-zelandiae CBS 107.79]|uniref:Uncharacterized protein n=1 Tax=Bimuria novae-zelandiae CBS 107.79 TaxID=1447943 RepID=A0A6A5UH50_9PLEO|nr:hypothetical protein BU23DRAFT_585749 [Bimuria novae-zelandiae CBS 107.79]